MISRLLQISMFMVFLVSAASAVTDPDPDHLGVYFDTDANQLGIAVGPSIPFNAFVVLTRPSRLSISSAAFQYRIEVTSGSGGELIRLQEIRNPADVTCIAGCDPTDTLEDYHVLSFEPALQQESAVVLLRWQFMLTQPAAVEFYLGPIDSAHFEGASPSYVGTGETVLLGSPIGSFSLPVGYVNTDIPLPVEAATFGAVKALYR